MGAVVEGHHRLTDPGVAAVELETLVQMVALHLPGVALHTAAVALRQGVHGLAERGVALEEVDVPALGVQDVGRDAGENIEVGEQPLQLLLVEKDVHGVHPSSSSAPWEGAEEGGPPSYRFLLPAMIAHLSPLVNDFPEKSTNFMDGLSDSPLRG